MTLALWLASDAFGGHDDGPVSVPHRGGQLVEKKQPFAISSEEQELAERLKGGDEAALATVTKMYWNALWRYAYHFLHSPDSADDVAQDVLFSLWSRRAHIDPVRGVRAYLFGAVRFQALKVQRHKATVLRIEQHNDAVMVAGVGEYMREGAEALNEQELIDALGRILSNLPEQRREVLLLRWWHGLTYDEIAEILGLGVSAVKMQVHRATALLLPLLEREFRER